MKKRRGILALALVGLLASCSNVLMEDKAETFVNPVRAVNMTSADAYEPDDSSSAATTITVDGGVQEHNFYDDATDWLKFTAVAGTTYYIETTVYGSADTLLYLYYGTTLKASNDDKASGDYGSLVTYTPSTSGTYYVKCYSYNGKKGTNRGYTVEVRTTADSGGGDTGSDVTLPQPSKNWTVMVYLDADNSLDGYDATNIAAMVGVGSSDYLNIVLLWDNTGTKHGYYYVTTDGTTLLSDVGEVNMGDAATAEAFIDYVATNFPAVNYGLVYWNHGGAAMRSVCWDDSANDDCLTEVEQKTIGEYAVAKFGKKLELIGFDACLMSCAEVVYQYRDIANYFAGSEQTEPGAGWDYAALSTVNASTLVGGSALAQSICSKYATMTASSTSDYTFSALDLSLADELAAAVDDFAAAAVSSMTTTYAAAYKKIATTSMSTFTQYTHDLYKYMAYVIAGSFPSDVESYAAAVQTAISNMVLLNKAGSTWTGKAYGVAITCKSDTTNYSLLDLCADTSWDEFCTSAGFSGSYTN